LSIGYCKYELDLLEKAYKVPSGVQKELDFLFQDVDSAVVTVHDGERIWKIIFVKEEIWLLQFNFYLKKTRLYFTSVSKHKNIFLPTVIHNIFWSFLKNTNTFASGVNICKK
jgi:hypothetical protein